MHTIRMAGLASFNKKHKTWFGCFGEHESFRSCMIGLPVNQYSEISWQYETVHSIVKQYINYTLCLQLEH